jgi:hypothetical protein
MEHEALKDCKTNEWVSGEGIVGVEASSLMPRKRANRRPVAPSEPKRHQVDDPPIHVVRQRVQVRQILRNDAARAEEDVVRRKVCAADWVRAQRIDAEDTYTCIDDRLCSLARDARVRRVRVECGPVLGSPRAEEQDLRPTRERGREVRRTDRRVRGLGRQVDHNRRADEHREIYLIDAFPACDEVRGRVDVCARVRAESERGDGAPVVLERQVWCAAEHRIVGVYGRRCIERVGEVDDLHRGSLEPRCGLHTSGGPTTVVYFDRDSYTGQDIEMIVIIK